VFGSIRKLGVRKHSEAVSQHNLNRMRLERLGTKCDCERYDMLQSSHNMAWRRGYVVVTETRHAQVSRNVGRAAAICITCVKLV
jgi:hypothetical protein